MVLVRHQKPRTVVWAQELWFGHKGLQFRKKHPMYLPLGFRLDSWPTGRTANWLQIILDHFGMQFQAELALQAIRITPTAWRWTKQFFHKLATYNLHLFTTSIYIHLQRPGLFWFIVDSSRESMSKYQIVPVGIRGPCCKPQRLKGFPNCSSPRSFWLVAAWLYALRDFNSWGGGANSFATGRMEC